MVWCAFNYRRKNYSVEEKVKNVVEITIPLFITGVRGLFEQNKSGDQLEGYQAPVCESLEKPSVNPSQMMLVSPLKSVRLYTLTDGTYTPLFAKITTRGTSIAT